MCFYLSKKVTLSLTYSGPFNGHYAIDKGDGFL